MRALWRSRSERDYLSDALTVLDEWVREGQRIRRCLPLDDSQHAALTERVKIVADMLHLRPEVHRTAGQTEIIVGARDGSPITEGDVTLAARIEEAYRTVTNGY